MLYWRIAREGNLNYLKFRACVRGVTDYSVAEFTHRLAVADAEMR